MKQFINLVLIGLMACCLMACDSGDKKNKAANDSTQIAVDSAETARNKEAREDSLKMAEALALQAKFTNIVKAKLETPPVKSEVNEDAADDPAIWVNTANPQESIVIGTNKKAGLHVYDLDGKELQFLPCGNVNNVDLRDGFTFEGTELVLVAASNRSSNTVSLFFLDKDSKKLSDVIYSIPSGVDDVYGLAMYHPAGSNDFYVFVNGKDGQVEQWFIKKTEEKLTAELMRTLKVKSQPEGMVADDNNGILYIGVEEAGIMKFKAAPKDQSEPEWLAGSDSTNSDISYDIEGLALYTVDDQQYLIASSQGSFSYAIFQLGEDEKYLTSFVIKDGTVDGVEETDGLEVVSVALGDAFPKGLLVVQDGFNYEGQKAINQNFKYINMADVLPFLNAK